MAKKETWEKLRYFRKSFTTDNWGNPDVISDEHLLRLDDFRHFLGLPLIVTHAAKLSGHNPGSYHYSKLDENGNQIGYCATDIMIPGYPDNAYNLVLDATRFFSGVGYYPDWKWNGKRIGGLHVDSRPYGVDPDGTPNYKHSRWMGVMIGGKRMYIDLNKENLDQHINKDSFLP